MVEPEIFTFDGIEDGDDDSVDNKELFLDDAEGTEDDVLLANSQEEINAEWSDVLLDRCGDFPSVDKWKDEHVGQVVSVFMGRGVFEVWEQAKDEVQCSRNGFDKCLGTTKPTIKQLVDYFTGPESELYRSISSKLGWSHEEFAHLLKTFTVQCAYKISARELYNPSGYVQCTGLMEEVEYVAKWRMLGLEGLPKDEKAAPATKMNLWMDVEASINRMLRTLVVEPWIPEDDTKRLDTVKVVFDDNKMHHDARQSNAQLKIGQHLRDNRRGPTHHDAVSSATGQIAGFRFKRNGDTTVSVVSAIVRDQFVPAQGGSLEMKLDFLEPYGDRAYTVKHLFFDLFVRNGAKVTGTKQRSSDFPFCYGMKLKEADKRVDVPLVGPKTLLMKSVDAFDRKVYAAAYRNGNGGVTLGTTTDSQCLYSWDLTLQDPGDRAWWSDLCSKRLDKVSILRQCFRPLDAKRKNEVITEELAALLEEQPIKPLTMGQATDHAWWICCSFGLSSTGSSVGFALFEGTEAELEHHAAWKIVKAYCKKTGERSWNNQSVKEESVKDEDASNDDESNNIDNNNSNEHGDFIESISIQRLLIDDDYAALLIEALEPESEDDEDGHIYVSNDAVRLALQSAGASLSQAANAMRRWTADRKKFVEWCRQPRILRSSFPKKTVANLRRIAAQLSFSIPCDITTATAIYKALHDHLVEHPDAELAEDAAPSIDLLSKPDKLLQALLSASYLKKQTGSNRSETRRGLALEKPLARRLVEDSKKGITASFTIEEVATVPLVMRIGVGKGSVIGSTDFIASVDSDAGKELIAIEVKARVKASTAERERSTQGLARLRLSSNFGLDEHKKKYYSIKADDDTFPFFVGSQKEALQILHHAYVYDVRRVLLLIGDDFARIIAGIFVEFDSLLKDAWGKVLADMHRLGLSFLYRDPMEPFELSADERERLDRVLPTVKAAGAAFDFQSFDQMIKIWRVVRLVWPNPLPPVSKLIPFIYSKWNAMKGGSDTITKLIWSAQYSPPNRLPQAHAIARMFLLIFIQIHRSNQIATSKTSMPYKSLQHFRNANNKRFSLHETLIEISNCFDTDSTETTEEIVTDDESVNAPEPELRNRATRGTKPTLVVKTGIQITGDTPKRSVRKTLSRISSGQQKPKGHQACVATRTALCTGIPFRSKHARGTCCVCGADTWWFCAGCHLNVCVNDISNEQKTNAKYEEFDCFELEVTIPAMPGKGKEKTIKGIANTCYLLHHRATIFKALAVGAKKET